MPKTRLIIAQGPLQLLNVISVLHARGAEYHSAANGFGSKEFDDILILGNYCGPDLDQVCIQTAQAWNFKTVLSFRAFEIFQQQHACDFDTLVTVLKENINIPVVDEIYVCRNWQLINEVFLAAYPDAFKICYGDGLGNLDLNGQPNEASAIPLNPKGFVAIDHSYLMVPMDSNDSFALTTYTQVKPEYFKQVVSDSARYIEGLKEYCNEIVEGIGPDITLAITSNHTESGELKNPDVEVECYLTCLLEYTEEGEGIVIKGHPRELYSQSKHLANELRKHNRRVVELPEPYIRIAVEQLSVFLPIARTFSLFSSSCVSLAYLTSSEFNIGFGERIIRQFFSGAKVQENLNFEIIQALFVEQALKGVFAPIRRREIERNSSSISSFHQTPIRFRKKYNSDNSYIESIAY